MSIPSTSFALSELPDNVSVGNYSSIAAGCYFHTGDEHYCAENKKYVSTFNFKHSQKDGHIEIGNDVWIGRGVSVLSGVKIGDGAIIGAHTVIAKDIPPFAVVVGNPCRINRFRFSPEVREKLLKIKWWNWERTLIEERSVDLEDVDLFVEKYAI